MYAGRLPTADNIALDWAPLTSTERDLPRLVQLLLIFSLDSDRMSVRVGDGVRSPGWDGRVEAALGNTWVPSGRSFWEMGAGDDPADKAQRDYRKRTDATSDSDRQSSTFVFVTPRRWDSGEGKDGWVRRKLEEGLWGDVRVIDADDLDAWLQRCLPAHVWLAEQVFGSIRGVQTLGQWWMEWSRNPPGVVITPEMVIVGRDAIVDLVREWVASPADYHPLKSSSSTVEALAFLAAALKSDLVAPYALDRVLVIENQEVWRRVIVSEKQSLVLVPIFQGPDSQGALDHGHVVIEPMPRDRRGQFEAELPVRSATDMQAALEGVGLPPEQAGRLAYEARADIDVLRRGLARDAAPRASWANSATARHLIPAVLAGGWDQSFEADQLALATLAGSEFETVERALMDIAGSADAPLKRRGDVWVVTSPVDVLRQVRAFMTSSDWTRFINIAIETLGESNPVWDLPAEERWMAGVRGVGQEHSSWLRRGLARTLAIAGSVPEFADLPGGRTGPQVATIVVRDVLARANADGSGGIWAGLSDELPLLAEAAPDEFLAALQVGSSGSTPVLRPLFEEQPSLIFARSSHPHLLWALERLAWSPDYLAAATVVLGRLASLDSGGRSAPRPLTSLREIYFPARPQTSASVEERIRSLEALRRSNPEVAWSLFVELIPTPGTILTATQKPEWRAWISAAEETSTIAQVLEFVAYLVDWLTVNAGTDGTRWRALVNVIPDLPATAAEPIVRALGEIGVAELTVLDRETIAGALREVIGRHTAFPEARWAIAADRVAQLEATAARIEPTDPVFRHRWLFTSWPAVERIRGEGYERRIERIGDERLAAVTDIHAASGWVGIEQLVEVVDAPGEVGRALTGLSDHDERVVLAWANSENGARRLAFDGYAAQRSWLEGWEWTEAVALQHRGEWDPLVMARFLLAARDEAAGWRLAAELGGAVENAYWSGFRLYPSDDNVWTAVAELIEHNQPWVAIDLAASARARPGIEVNAELAYAALDAAARANEPPPPEVATGLQHDVAELFSMLDGAGFDGEKLAGLEWVFLEVLEHSEYSPKHITERLAADPTFFVEVIGIVFREQEADQHRPVEDAEPTEEEVRYARQGYHLLMNWRRCPGTAEDGSLDREDLLAWTVSARELLSEANRIEIGDQRIGHVLWYAPPGADGLHPHEAVRELIERVASPEIERGFAIEAFNSEGVRFRRRGGADERDRSDHFRTLADELASEWPRMAHVYRRLADDYQSMADREDREEELREERL